MPQEPVSITGVWLRTTNSRVQVLVEIDKQWRLCQNDFISYDDGKYSPCSHIYEANGIRNAPIDALSDIEGGQP